MNWTLIVLAGLTFSTSIMAESAAGLSQSPRSLASEIKRLQAETPPHAVAAVVESGPAEPTVGPRWTEQYAMAPYYRSESRYYFAFFGISAEFRASEEVALSTSGEPVMVRYLARRGYDLNVKSLELVDNKSLLAIIDQ